MLRSTRCILRRHVCGPEASGCKPRECLPECEKLMRERTRMKPAAAHTTPAAARRSHRSLLEPLERRALLSASAIVPAPGSPVAPTQSAADAGFVAITWDGHETFARPGQFVVRFDGVSGTPAQQLR